MSSKSLHYKYINENGVIAVLFSKLFTDDELSFLGKYFKWGLGLVNGEIPPITKEQENFIATFHKYIKDKETPPLRNDVWFSNLNPMQKAWVKYFYVQQLGNRILDFTVDQNSLNIYKSLDDKTSTRSTYPKKSATTKKNQKSKLQPVKVKSRNCISCGASIGVSKNYKCDKCFVPITKKKKPKRGSITTNRMTFHRTKWNNDRYER